jgi:integrase/recombinase XerD
MATLKITLDKRRTKNDGTCPVVIRVTHKSHSRDIPTEYSANFKSFSSTTGTFRHDDEANLDLYQLVERYSERLKELRTGGIDHLSAQEIKELLLTSKSKGELTIYDFWKSEIQHLRAVNRQGSATVYNTTLNVFEPLLSLKIPFDSFTYKELLLLERHLFSGGRNINTVGVYMRTFRAICNKAIHQGLVSSDWYPFRNYKIRKAKTTPRVMTLEEMKAFFLLDVAETETHFPDWCIGKLLFLLRGINLYDLLTLKPSNIKGKRLIYQRRKTGKSYSIEILPEIESLLQRFHSNHLLLGMFSKAQMQDPEKFVYVMGQKRKLINNRLKELGKRAGTEEPITTYVFRYSYANIAKQLGFPKDLIAEALGHEYGNSVTGIYLEMFDQQTLDHMNAYICKTVNSRSSDTL